MLLFCNVHVVAAFKFEVLMAKMFQNKLESCFVKAGSYNFPAVDYAIVQHPVNSLEVYTRGSGIGA